jgi:hypothetical protein
MSTTSSFDYASGRNVPGLTPLQTSAQHDTANSCDADRTSGLIELIRPSWFKVVHGRATWALVESIAGGRLGLVIVNLGGWQGKCL